MESKSLNLRLQVWRQPSTQASGKFETYELPSVPVHASFLEMLDLLNEQLITEGREPVAFDHDCREGICGMCSLYINGRAHGPHARLNHRLMEGLAACASSSTSFIKR